METLMCEFFSYNLFKINTTKWKALSTFLLECDYLHYKDHKSACYFQCSGHFQVTDRLFYPGTKMKSHTTILSRMQKWILVQGDKTWTFAAQWDCIVPEESFCIWPLFLIIFIIKMRKIFVSGNISRTPGSTAAHLTEIGGWVVLFVIYMM